jgi:hypothetical protein
MLGAIVSRRWRKALSPDPDAGYARPAGPSRRSVLQGPDQPVHDRRGSGHEARSRVRLRREGASRKSPVAVNREPLVVPAAPITWIQARARMRTASGVLPALRA